MSGEESNLVQQYLAGQRGSPDADEVARVLALADRALADPGSITADELAELARLAKRCIERHPVE